jgi:predicted phosphodiesterase
MKITILPQLTLIVILFTSCGKLTDYSPYDADISNTDVHSYHLDRIRQTEVSDTVKFALIADTHSYYDDLADAISSINQQEGLQFVVCCGDITDSGLAQEYNWYCDLIKKLKYPIITVIGNHDYLSNGSVIYRRIFGPSNFSFTINDYKFMAFDDVVWENSNRSPQFDWLRSELQNDTIKKCILLAHIPPWTDQLEGIYSQIYEEIVKNSNIMLCLHGHNHQYEEKEFASVPSVVSGSVIYRSYNIISLFNNEYSIKRISF